ncbi:MAG TPA: zinc ribbon domain-containing protein [Acidimicrobiales bacterium]|nr:zinc ribbon domain-containing protein [Acidimicrobiales bacterium]
MPDAKTEMGVCPFCKEEVRAAAVRCKHCLADIPPAKPDHGGVCPLCKEDINAEATRCPHCQADLAAGTRFFMAPARRPARILRRRLPEPFEGGRPRGRRVPVEAAERSSSCPPRIETRYGTYHLVDEGIGADGWHYCGYEPGAYGIFDDDDLVPYTPTVLSE